MNHEIVTFRNLIFQFTSTSFLLLMCRSATLLRDFEIVSRRLDWPPPLTRPLVSSSFPTKCYQRLRFTASRRWYPITSCREDVSIFPFIIWLLTTCDSSTSFSSDVFRTHLLRILFLILRESFSLIYYCFRLIMMRCSATSSHFDFLSWRYDRCIYWCSRHDCHDSLFRWCHSRTRIRR